MGTACLPARGGRGVTKRSSLGRAWGSASAVQPVRAQSPETSRWYGRLVRPRSVVGHAKCYGQLSMGMRPLVSAVLIGDGVAGRAAKRGRQRA